MMHLPTVLASLAMIMACHAKIAATNDKGIPTFKISKATSRDALPQIEVKFDDGQEDFLLLEPYGSSACNYIGRLASSDVSSAAVTGCLDRPGDQMDVTLLSDHYKKSHMFQVDFHGNVAVVENPFKDQASTTEMVYAPAFRKDDQGYTKTDGDEMMDEKEEELADLAESEPATSSAFSYPNSANVALKFGVDKSMADRMATDKTTFPEWIEQVMAHAQAYYKHPTLPTQIHFVYDTAATLTSGNTYTAETNLKDVRKASLNDPDYDKVNLYAWWADDPKDYGVLGVAYVGTACRKPYKVSFNEHSKTISTAAYVLSHEIGHNLGMSHDFSVKHGGDGNPGSGGPCDNQGIMSYGDAPTKWSDCSVKDFSGHYEINDWGNTCFEASEVIHSSVQPTICNDKATWCGTVIWACTYDSYKDYMKNVCNKTCGYCTK